MAIMEGGKAMDPELRWLIKLVFAVGSLASLIDAGRRRGWI